MLWSRSSHVELGTVGKGTVVLHDVQYVQKKDAVERCRQMLITSIRHQTKRTKRNEEKKKLTVAGGSEGGAKQT